ncbi:glycosyltransferase family 2 protein [Maridesulfovibrio hydrothermalis]|uniref:Glycosyltransferase 2-like domain-containing protein n=1 Tax=Maridesulfovibrio hydrothermalis AM13 = DSM 14728 TaxID=1121451 RepID=L0R8Z1_9BACT|nr:glycosyltransferase family 2 protein [Maridesulfovibrio hydrothermalis]CCO23228.1 conserved protein of unknown function [Maridesulfovibrio hydrothermalis AM13 = DSM 14728]
MNNPQQTAFFTVFYPGAELYFNDFARSLEKQTYKNFDITFVNDGMQNISSYMNDFTFLNWKEFKVSGSPEKIREKALVKLKKAGYQYIILGDADDFFKENRIAVARDYLKKNDIVVNDVSLFDEKGFSCRKWFSNRLQNNTNIRLEFILDKNIFGLSNTSIRTECIDENFSVREDTVATDWHLFASMLAKDFKAIFTNDTETLYRQHQKNAAGLGKISEAYILRGITAKKVVLEELNKIQPLFLKQYAHFKKREKEIQDPDFFKKYFERVKQNNINYPLWWEEIF